MQPTPARSGPARRIDFARSGGTATPCEKAPSSPGADSNLQVERTRETRVTALRPLHPRSVTSLKTLVPWAKSTKLGTVTVKPFSFWARSMNSLKSESKLSSSEQATAHGRQEVRCAVRFPLSLPVVLSAGANEIAGLTRNISASGVLFALSEDLPVGLDRSEEHTSEL